MLPQGNWGMSIRQDLRYASRALHRSCSYALIGGLTLTLGIGASTAMFSVIRAALLSSLPFPNEDALMMLWPSNAERGGARELVSPANFVDWDAQNTVFEQLGAWPTTSDAVAAFNVRWKDSSERVRGTYISSGFFRVLGVQPVLGRTFVRDEDRVRDHRAAVVSYSYWRERFGGDPAVLGKDHRRGHVSRRHLHHRRRHAC